MMSMRIKNIEVSQVIHYMYYTHNSLKVKLKLKLKYTRAVIYQVFYLCVMH